MPRETQARRSLPKKRVRVVIPNGAAGRGIALKEWLGACDAVKKKFRNGKTKAACLSRQAYLGCLTEE